MDRLRFALSALLFFLVVFTLFTGVTAANNTTTQKDTLKVPDPWNTRTGTSYTTIQEAIDDAQPGDTIIAETGTYTENIQINKKITLTGQGTVTIQAQNPDQPTITITADKTTITGFTIKNGKHGIHIQANQCTITNNTITNNNEAGINLYESSDNTITKNNITNNSKDGIHLEWSSNNTISNNNITDNYYYEWWGIEGHGINLYESSNNTITKNNINNNGDGIGFSGSNNTISGNNITNNSWGIYFSGSNNTISGNNITNNSCNGIRFSGSNNTISGNNITNNSWDGIYLDWGSSNNTITGNNITNNSEDGISFIGSNKTTISWNNITNNSEHGICISSSPGSVLRGNVVENCSYGFSVEGNNLEDFILDVDTSNTIDGKPIYYLVGCANSVYDGVAMGYLALINCKNITVMNVELSGNGNGILIVNTTNSKIQNSKITNNWDGIYFAWYSSGNTITGNNITNNSLGGISLWYSSDNNTISNNTIINNDGYGIYFYSSSNNTITGNNINNNRKDGICLSNSNNNIISGNKITNNKHGTYLYYSKNNRVYRNSFIGNEVQAQVSDSTGNVFNLTKPIGGNFWSDYIGTDGDEDGFGDIPYFFTGGQDNLPLIITITVSNLTVTPISGVAPLNVTAKANITNSGYIQRSYTAQLKINNQVVDSKTVIVPAMTTITIEFKRTLQKGTYNITINNLTPITVKVISPLIVNSIDPVNGAASVPLNKTIVVTFNWNIQAGPGYNKITVKLPNGTAKTITKWISGNKLYIKATGGWNPGVKFIVTIPKNAVKNSLGSMLQTEFKSSFVAAIKVKSIDPANGAVNVPKTKTIIVTFSNNILAGPGYNKITVKTSTGTTKTITKSITGNKLYIKATGGWNPGVKFIVTIPKNAVKNSLGSMLQTDFKSSFAAAK